MKRLLFVLPAALIILGCSDTSKKAESKKPEPPPEAISGQTAFFRMYGAARQWATDIQGMQLRSIHLREVPSEPGKAGAWQAVFVSPGKRRARSYTYSVIEAEGNLHKGVFAGQEESYSGPRGQVKPFLIAALKVDSPDALATALKNKGDEYTKKNPDMAVNFLLENNAQHANASWRVIWGDSVGTSNFSVYVDASTGRYLQTMR